MVSSANRAIIEERYAILDATHSDSVPYPSFWGGYELIVDCAEFWQGRVGRMHDRMRYTADGDVWRIQRLLP